MVEAYLIPRVWLLLERGQFGIVHRNNSSHQELQHCIIIVPTIQVWEAKRTHHEFYIRRFKTSNSRLYGKFGNDFRKQSSYIYKSSRRANIKKRSAQSIYAESKGFTSTGNQYLGAPSDFLAPFSLTIFKGTASGNYAKEFLQFKDLSFIETYNPDYTVTGKPKYYAQFDVGNFYISSHA